MFRVYFKSTGYRCCRSIALVQMFSTREEHSLHVYKTYICRVDLMQIKEMKDAAWMAVGSHVLDIKIATLGVETAALKTMQSIFDYGTFISLVNLVEEIYQVS